MSTIWPTKVREADLPLLRRLAGRAKVAHHVPRVWKRVARGQPTLVALEPPIGAAGVGWKSVYFAGQGMTLGGASALGEDGRPVYRGQQIFPTGIAGDATKRWDGVRPVRLPRFQIYDHLLDRDRLFAGRKIAQLPTVAKVEDDGVFQDTVIAMQLSTDLPLHVWTLARPVQWYAAKVVRSGIIEDLGASWHKRQYLSLPAPPPDADLVDLERAGRQLLAADLDLADGRRHVSTALAGTIRTSLARMIADGRPATVGITFDTPMTQPVRLSEIRVEGEKLVSPDGGLSLAIPDAGLRRFLAYHVSTLALEGEPTATEAEILAIRVPEDLGTVVEAIERFERDGRAAAFEAALDDLDVAAAHLVGLTDQEASAIATAMRTEPFLREIKPAYAHRGARTQRLRPEGDNPYR